MTSKSVIISGANGYFGGIACQYFQQLGWSVLKATRQAEADIHFELDFPEQFAKIKIDCHADVFIHAAAAHEVTCNKHPYRSIFYNVAGTKAALDFCILNKIQYFVYLSTFHVFGNPQGIIDESNIPCPVNDYGLSHLQAEQYVQMYTKVGGIKGLVVRPSNFFGIPANLQTCDRWTLIPLSFCKEAVERSKITLRTSGLQTRNFVAVTDICAAIVKAIELQKLEILHIFGNDTLSIKELAQLVQKVMRKELLQDVVIEFPTTPSHDHQNILPFTYTSLYLDTLITSKACIEDFVAAFCIELRQSI